MSSAQAGKHTKFRKTTSYCVIVLIIGKKLTNKNKQAYFIQDTI